MSIPKRSRKIDRFPAFFVKCLEFRVYRLVRTALTGNKEQGMFVTGDLSPRQDLPPVGGRLKPKGGFANERTDYSLLPVPSPEGS